MRTSRIDSQSPMRYFTPELFARFNSENEEVADFAQEEWDSINADYRQHADELSAKFPFLRDLIFGGFHDSTLRSVEEQRLHDDSDPSSLITAYQERGAYVQQVVHPLRAISTVQVHLQSPDGLLVYFVWDKLQRHVSDLTSWPVREYSTLWIADEVDVVWAPFRQFVHRILLASGETYVIPFRSFKVLRAGTW